MESSPNTSTVVMQSTLFLEGARAALGQLGYDFVGSQVFISGYTWVYPGDLVVYAIILGVAWVCPGIPGYTRDQGAGPNDQSNTVAKSLPNLQELVSGLFV